jgi:predicted DNA-binding transcriptional regulator YafY
MVDNKNRILHLQQYLLEQTDEAHPVTIADIMKHLSEAGISVTRKTLAQDIEHLINVGVDVVCNQGRQNQYFIGERTFELPELKLLIDAVQASKFLTAKRSRSLIDKLLASVSRYQALEMKSGLHFNDQIKPKNEHAYITVDILLTAIGTNTPVQFMYYEYRSDKKRTYKHNRKKYLFSPWYFIWDSDRYYILGYSENHGKAVTFRIDRIAAPKLAEHEYIAAPDGFDLTDYVKSVFSMYDGPFINVTLKCENALMKTIIDRYGEDVPTSYADTDHFYATVSVSASKTFYGWVFGLDGEVKITAPIEAVDAYKKMLDRAKSLCT